MTRSWLVIILLLGILGYELAILAILCFYPYIPDPGLVTINALVLETLAPISILLLPCLLYSWLIKIGTRKLRSRSKRFNSCICFMVEPFRKKVDEVKKMPLSDSAETLGILSRPKTMLATGIVISILLVLIPYRPDTNPTGVLVGIDSPSYVEWVHQMLVVPPLHALQDAFVLGLDGSRPLLLLLLYLIGLAGWSPSLVIKYLPVFLAPLLSLSNYVFVRYGQGSSHLAGLTSIFTPISFYSTVGLWGGYYANWLGLSFAYVFLTTLLAFSNTPSRSRYAMLYIVSLGLFLIHPWTWALVAMISLIFAISLWRETHNTIHVKSILAIIVTGTVVDATKSFAFATRTVGGDILGKFYPASVPQLANFWVTLIQALLYTHGGLMGNWLVLGLATLSAFALRLNNSFERLLIFWTAVSSIPFALLDSYQEARIIYSLPIPVLTSIAIVFLFSHVKTGKILLPELAASLLLLVVANYAIQGVLFA